MRDAQVLLPRYISPYCRLFRWYLAEP